MKDMYVSSVENLGTASRVLRGAVTMALVYLLLDGADGISGAEIIFAAAVASIYFGLTALWGWDPMRAIAGRTAALGHVDETSLPISAPILARPAQGGYREQRGIADQRRAA